MSKSNMVMEIIEAMLNDVNVVDVVPEGTETHEQEWLVSQLMMTQEELDEEYLTAFEEDLCGPVTEDELNYYFGLPVGEE